MKNKQRILVSIIILLIISIQYGAFSQEDTTDKTLEQAEGNAEEMFNEDEYQDNEKPIKPFQITLAYPVGMGTAAEMYRVSFNVFYGVTGGDTRI